MALSLRKSVRSRLSVRRLSPSAFTRLAAPRGRVGGNSSREEVRGEAFLIEPACQRGRATATVIAAPNEIILRRFETLEEKEANFSPLIRRNPLRRKGLK